MRRNGAVILERTEPRAEIFAWGTFDGTAGTPAFADSENFSSITDNGTGDWTLVFITPLLSADSVAVTANQQNGQAQVFNTGGITTADVRIQGITTDVNVATDRANVSVVVMGNH